MIVPGDHITIHLKENGGPPYAISGQYKGAHTFSGRDWTKDSVPYLVVEGTVGEQIGKHIYVPHEQVVYIEHNPVM